MPLDIIGYRDEYKDFFKDKPLEDVAKYAYTRHGYDKQSPDYETWKKEAGISNAIEEDNRKRNPSFLDKLSASVASVAPQYADITTSALKGATGEYAPSVATPKDASFGRKAATGAAHLAGMTLPIMAIETGLKMIPGVGEVVAGLEGAAGGVYGALRKPEEGETRATNALKDAAMFAVFGVGGRMLGKGIAKAIPEVGRVIEKLKAGEPLTGTEKVIHSASQYGQSGVLGMGAGATEPADTWEQRLQNIAMGGATFAGAHGITSSLMQAREAHKDSKEAAEYIGKAKLGAQAIGLMDIGTKTGKVGEHDWTPEDTATAIKDLHANGIFDDADLDRLKVRYSQPVVRAGVNEIIADSIINQVNDYAGPRQVPWQDFTLKGEPYYNQEGVAGGKPHGPEILKPFKPKTEEPIDAEFTDIRQLEAPKREEIKALPAGQGFELVNTLKEPENIQNKPSGEAQSKEIADLQDTITKQEDYLSRSEKYKGTPAFQRLSDTLAENKAKLSELTGKKPKDESKTEPVPQNLTGGAPNEEGKTETQTRQVISEQPAPEAPAKGAEAVKELPRFEVGRLISNELGQSSLKPQQDDLKKAADKYGITIPEANKSLSVFNDPDGGDTLIARERMSINSLAPEQVQAPALNSQKARKSKAMPKGVIGRIIKLGGMNVGGDYNRKELAQYPDLKRAGVLNKNGMTPDNIASILNEERYNVGAGDELIEHLKTGRARQIFNPETADAQIEKQIQEAERGHIERQLAELETKGIDPGRIEAGGESIKADLLSEIRADGYPPEAEEKLDNFFENIDHTHADRNAKADLQTEIPGAEFKNTFDLAPDNAGIGSKPIPHPGDKTGKLFEEPLEAGKIPSAAGKNTENKPIDDFGEKVGGARKDTAERGYAMASKSKPKDTTEPWRKKYVAMERVDGSGWTLGKTGDKWGISARTGQKFATQEEAEKAIPIVAVAETHSIYSNDDGTYSIYKRVSDRKRLKVVNQDFPSREEAMKYMAQNAERLLNSKTSFGEEILPVPEIARREGVPRRTTDATPEMFMETFKPRGIEFGNWNNQGERQQVLNHAYDGLLDLADALGLPPKALMLNGDLAIAFGARGQGLAGAAAHYERDYSVINLTKMQGAGKLAHEWLHAMDHYLGRQDTKASSEKVKNKRGDLVYPAGAASDEYASHGFSKRNSGVRQELRDDYEKLIESMYKRAEKYVDDTKQADRFVGAARENLREHLNGIRNYLSRDDSQYYKNKFGKPASAEQLAEFDRLANVLVEGGNLETTYKMKEKSRSVFGGAHHTNDTLDAMNAVMKAAKNRQGFNSEHTGYLDRLVAAMGTYSSRIKMFEDAQAGTEKTKKVPTSYAIEAKKMDQARVGSYWSEPHEMAARAFSAYVEDKIAEQGGQSDFLVYHAHGGILLPMIDGFVARPYPEGKERESINKLFDKFIQDIETRETDKGGAMHSVRAPFDKGTDDAIIKSEGDKNGQKPTTDTQSGNAGRKRLLPEVREEHGRRVEIERRRLLEEDNCPPRLKEAIQNGQGLSHYPEGYDAPEYKEAQDITSAFGLDLVPISDTSKQINGYVRDNTIFINMGTPEAGTSILRTVLHELSHFKGNARTQSKIDVTSSAFRQYRMKLSRYFGRTLTVPHILEEYAADLESGVKERYDVNLSGGLKKGESVATIHDELNRLSGVKIEPLPNPSRPPTSGGQPQYSLAQVGKTIDDYKDKLDRATDKIESIKTAKDAFGKIYEGMVRSFYPAALSKDTAEVSQLLIEQMGKNFHRQAELKGKLNEVVKQAAESTSILSKGLDAIQTSTGVLADGLFNKMPKEKQWDFISKIQKGEKQESQTLQGIADTISRMFDDLWKEADKVMPGKTSYRENYFPGMWEDREGAEKFFTQRSKNMEGTKAHTEAKVFDNIMEGIDAGFVPRGTPVDMAFEKLNDMQKYITSHRVLQQMEADKTAILVRAGEKAPSGYTLIPEPYGIITKKIGADGKEESYHYAAKEDIAQVISNYLSRSLYDNPYVGQIYKAYMGAANTLNQFQLGIGSAFHAGFMSMEAVISKFALGVKAAARGDLAETAKLMAEAPLQVYRNPMLGDAILRAYRGGAVHGQEIPQIINWLEMAGARAHMENRLQTTSTDKMLADWTKGDKLSAAARSPFALIEQLARPIMEWLVPRQKFGVFAEMAHEWSRQHPEASHEDTREAMQYIWNRTDSRMGQVVYERLLTHNVAKNIVQGFVRAPGWTGGTIVEVGGGLNDFVNVFRDIANGKNPVMTDKMAYTISLLTVTGLINGVMTKLLTGDDPKDGMDLLAFRTGKIDEHGNPERMLLPTYAKDIYAYINKPGQTLLNKTHPILSLMSDIAKNRDYYGVQIRDKEDNPGTQTLQVGEYALKAFVPFWMRGAQKEQERGDSLATIASPLIGIMPATAEFTKTKAQALMSEILQDRSKGTMPREQADRNQLKQKLETRLRNNDATALSDMAQYIKDGKLSRSDVSLVRKSAKIPYEVKAFKTLSLKEAMRVYAKGTPEEKKTFLPLLRNKAHLLQDLPEEEKQDVTQKLRQIMYGENNV